MPDAQKTNGVPESRLDCKVDRGKSLRAVLHLRQTAAGADAAPDIELND